MYELNTDRKLLDEEKSSIELVTRKNQQTNTYLNEKSLNNIQVKDDKSGLNWSLIKNEVKNFIDKIEKEEKSILCITGKGFEYILTNYKEEKQQNKKNKNNENKDNHIFKTLAKIVVSKGKIFSRMQPSNKVNLVNFLKENKSNIVAMCGDGANDCGALLSADIGISISHKKTTNITSHFYSSEESISCVENILKNGRACFENSVIIVKCMILYGSIQTCTYLVLFYINTSSLTNPQCFYIDCFIVLISSLLVSKTGANYKLIKETMNGSITNIKFLMSILGQIVIQIGTQFTYFYYFILNRIRICGNPNSKENLPNSYLFIYTTFQYLSVIFAFNSNSKHRKNYYANKTFIFYTSIILFLTMSFITVESINKLGKLNIVELNTYDSTDQDSDELNKLITLLWILINFCLTIGYEGLINYLINQ